MLIEPPKPLDQNLGMPCYACEKNPATHVCRFKVGELTVQVCLCSKCMQIDTKRLLKNTIGINGLAENTTSNYILQGGRSDFEALPESTV